MDDNQTPNDSSSEPTDDVKLVMPDGTPIENDSEKQREKDRKSEDDDFVPVIIKRTDETRRHPDDALKYAIEEGLEQMSRPALALLLSAIAAGLSSPSRQWSVKS